VKRVGELLKAFLSSRISEEGEGVLSLVEAWREVAAEAARHVRVRDYRNGTVVLEADHPGWGQLVGLRAPALLKSLRTRLPELEIQALKVTVGRTPAASEAVPGRASRQSVGVDPPGQDTAAEARGIEERLSGLPDEGLRRALRALYEKAEDPEGGTDR
jgi:hypothetical protein